MHFLLQKRQKFKKSDKNMKLEFTSLKLFSVLLMQQTIQISNQPLEFLINPLKLIEIEISEVFSKL